MAEAAAPPGSIRMTVSSESPTSKEEEKPGIKKKQWKPWFEFEERDSEYGMWYIISALIVVMLNWSSYQWWIAPIAYYVVLIGFTIFVIVYRMMLLRKADPACPRENLVKSGFMSIFLVIGGYVSGLLAYVILWVMLLI